MVLLGYSTLLLASKFLIILITQTDKCRGQFGVGVPTVDTNSDTSNIPVMVFQGNKTFVKILSILFEIY